MHVYDIHAPTKLRNATTSMRGIIPRIWYTFSKIQIPHTAPNLPEAAEIPLKVARMLVAKTSCGSTKVVMFGPQFTDAHRSSDRENRMPLLADVP